ncbi:sensor histidine kinase [Tessaracoccus antarcticus]|uniref:histidine kinase n=1 Tax=Tessaracoccus antarcticus TaxID=2479848 RepID=A0A3M0GGW5_9ACTN|nr:ATP-binding protein [Tessaracoccus antarcticus]RMB61962.1 HAMP domain-containing protein [Tessaracoccus antarcticus]
MERRRFRWFPRGIRLRTTVAATVVVALALLGASVALVALQRQQLISGLTDVARQQGDTIVGEIEEGGIDEVDVGAVKAAVGDSALLQILTPDGTVRTASDDDYLVHPITTSTPPAGDTVVYTVDALPGGAEPFVIVVSGVASPGGVVRVVTAQSLESVERSTTVLVTLLSIGIPLVLVVVAATSSMVVGWALAPVEAIRRHVAGVSTADKDARVPVPTSGDEIARLAETMNSMLARLQASAEAQHRFVADASHELRTPLATIRTTTELATLHPEAMDRDRAAGLVLAETHRLERLVSDLLLLARSDEHGLIMNVEDVDLDDIVTGEIARIRAQGALTVEVDVVSVRVTGDAQHLLRAVRNLMDNAVRFASTTVEVRLGTMNGVAVLDISDDGPGIAGSERERVFERFVRLDDSRERGTGGTGLGLAITREIARAHGGDVQVFTSERGGAHLRLSLPLPLPAGAAAHPPPSAARR